MSTKGVADIVFCLDASGSMNPCFDGVRNHVTAFVEGLRSSGQTSWDLRFDFVAHRCSGGGGPFRVEAESVFNRSLPEALYGPQPASKRFFTSDVDEIRRSLASVTTGGDEAALVGLDCALDFPWRDAAACHRVVIQMTDEPFETGAGPNEQKALLEDLIQKIQDLRVMLFLVSPNSPIFRELAQVDRSEWTIPDSAGQGLSRVDFQQVLATMGKSVSASMLQGGPVRPVRRGLFGQVGWS